MLLLVAVGLIGLPVLGAILWIDKHNIEHERETRTEIDNLIELVAEKHDYELTFYTVFAGQLLFSLAAVGLLVLLAIRMTRSRTLAAANRQLEDARTLMQATLDAAPVAITIRDENLRFVFANEAALEKFKLTRGQIFGRTTREALGDWQDPDYIEYLDRVDREVLRSGEPLPFDTYSSKRDGTWSQALVGKTPIVDAAGKITHVVTLSVDVTELKKAEALAIAAKEEAELANLAKSEFLANMSHELRTPLNAIIGFSEVMLSETFGPLNNTRYEDYVRDIHTSGDHLHKIISDLLDVARIEMGEIEFELVDIDVGQVLDSVRVMEMGKAENAGIALFDRTERPLPPVRGDAVRLRQIFINLIDNAIKFTEPGGRIELSATVVEGNRLAITVADTGIGIPVDDIDRVVEPFVRLHPSATNNASGTGLGLSLVKSLVELHGGEMTIDSEPGWGTQITVTLPCTKSSLRVVAAGRAIA